MLLYLPCCQGYQEVGRGGYLGIYPTKVKDQVGRDAVRTGTQTVYHDRRADRGGSREGGYI